MATETAPAARLSDAEAFAALIRRRFGPVTPACATCRHAWPVKLSLIRSGYECRRAPPQPLFAAPVQGGAITGMLLNPDIYVPRLVAANFFCSEFAPEVDG